MKVLIIEDEKPASAKLIRLLTEMGIQIDILAILESVEESINWLYSHPEPNLIFMDIQLEDGICFEIFEQYNLKTPVIFTTAYDKYTLNAFKVNSIDYLIKPIDPDELKKAIYKFQDIHHSLSTFNQIEFLLKQMQPKTKARFLIKVGEHLRSISINQIAGFYVQAHYTFLLTNLGKSYPVEYSLDKIEKVIDPDIFFRINRNFIIRYDSIRDILIYSSNRLKLKFHNQLKMEDIIVSRTRVNRFKKWMDR